jgi:hypothetical protein
MYVDTPLLTLSESMAEQNEQQYNGMHFLRVFYALILASSLEVIYI